MLRSLRTLRITSSRALSLTHSSISSRWLASLGAAEYQKQHEIKVKGCDIGPVEEFSLSPFPEQLQKRLSDTFPSPTPIQAQTWPIAVTGKDMIGIARTGSGKTLAYLLPGFLKILKAQSKDSRKRRPKILVLVPTRELAVQIHKESEEYGAPLGIRTLALYGGVSKLPQTMDLSKGCDVVIGTPGRLNDLLDDSVLNVNEVSYLVLDEADRMLDMGFEPQISSIIRELGAHQTMMFTATWPTEVQELAEDYLNKPALVRIGHAAGSDLVLPKSIRHEVFNVSQREKQRKLIELLKQLEEEKATTLIFANTKAMCEILQDRMRELRIRSGTLHGDISQKLRQLTIDNIRNKKISVLIATDVAARGLDISNITNVINYDFPANVQDWIHRVGRTGRAGREGVAHTLFEPSRDSKHASLLAKVLIDAGQEPPEWLHDLSSDSSPSTGGFFRSRGYARTSSLRDVKRAFDDFKALGRNTQTRPRVEGSSFSAFRRRGTGEEVLSASRSFRERDERARNKKQNMHRRRNEDEWEREKGFEDSFDKAFENEKWPGRRGSRGF